MTCMTQPVSIPEHLFVAIDHVGVAVPDLDEAIAFYRDVFGMRVAHEETNEEQGVREAMVAVGDSGPSGASSWMNEPESPTATIASRTPCSSLVSSCATRIPNTSR